MAQGLCGFAGGHWDLFFAQLINGISLGGIYALIALGYTMIYGIIELINFAHGDVYTLGTFFSLAILDAARGDGCRHRAAADRRGDRHDARRDDRLRARGRDYRAAGLSPAAQRAAARAADHGDRDVVHPRERDAVLARPLADPVSGRHPQPRRAPRRRHDRDEADHRRRAGGRADDRAAARSSTARSWARRCARPRRTAKPPN